jgi:predicted amidophosphoribosyltransferase
MTCPQCNVENPPGGKFCSSCGSVLAKACSECGASARPDDRFCSACGQSLTAAAAETLSRQPIPPIQYSMQDIEELLILRRMIRKEEIATKTLNQNDVDKLFG